MEGGVSTKVQQYSLNFDAIEDFLEENYIVSSANLEAYNLIIQNFPHHFGINPYPKSLLLMGAKSSGKSHMSSIWAKKNNAEFLTPSSTIPNKALAAVIDDIEAYDETSLLHLFNYYHEEKRFLLMTASSIADFTLQDLKSRINAINIVRIGNPDEEMIKILLMRCFSSRSLKVSSNVIEYLAARITRDYNSIKDTVAQLDQLSSSYKKPITIPFVKEVMK